MSSGNGGKILSEEENCLDFLKDLFPDFLRICVGLKGRKEMRWISGWKEIEMYAEIKREEGERENQKAKTEMEKC